MAGWKAKSKFSGRLARWGIFDTLSMPLIQRPALSVCAFEMGEQG